MPGLHYRLATEADTPALGRIYAAAVRRLGPERYSARQVEAWAATGEDSARFAEHTREGYILVAEANSEIAGFGKLHPDDRIALLYVAPEFGRHGIASELLRRLEAEARRRGATSLRTEASQFSRTLFSRHGFVVVEPEIVTYNDVVFERWKMRKQL